jgi:hypothetical protein
MAEQYPLLNGGTAGAQSAGTASYPLLNGGNWTVLAASPPPELTGINVGVQLGTMTPVVDVTAALTGNAVGVSLGVLTPVASVTLQLTGIQVGVGLGTLTPNVNLTEVPLTGIQVGVRTGYMRAPPILYDLAWTRPAYRPGTIPSYLYIQYNDDDDLQAFVEAYNALSLELMDWFRAINLPVYTGDLIVGALLDWVALGLYGQPRPTLPSGVNKNLGPYNTLQFNSLPFNAIGTVQPTEFYATTDDVLKRILTWNFYKGDGRQFSVRWLKRRIMRFLVGENGTDPGIDETYQISIGFGTDRQVDIRILSGLRTVTGGAVFNLHGFNEQPFNAIETVYEAYVPLEFAPIFKAAVDGGALQLPFQYTWIVTI